jgi:hypothetical protein
MDNPTKWRQNADITRRIAFRGLRGARKSNSERQRWKLSSKRENSKLCNKITLQRKISNEQVETIRSGRAPIKLGNNKYLKQSFEKTSLKIKLYCPGMFATTIDTHNFAKDLPRVASRR